MAVLPAGGSMVATVPVRDDSEFVGLPLASRMVMSPKPARRRASSTSAGDLPAASGIVASTASPPPRPGIAGGVSRMLLTSSRRRSSSSRIGSEVSVGSSDVTVSEVVELGSGGGVAVVGSFAVSSPDRKRNISATRMTMAMIAATATIVAPLPKPPRPPSSRSSRRSRSSSR